MLLEERNLLSLSEVEQNQQDGVCAEEFVDNPQLLASQGANQHQSKDALSNT